MPNELMISFNFEDNEVRTVERDGETWFVLTDVCRVLGIANPSDAAKSLEDYEKGIDSSYTLGGEQSLIVVNESGLYNLIFRSRKPAAKAFKKWVTTEVLPSIRKRGHYGTDLDIVEPADDRDSKKSMAERLKEEIERFDRDTGMTFAKAGIVSRHKISSMTMQAGSLIEPMHRAKIWVRLISLGFDMPYILWGTRTLSERNTNPMRQNRLADRAMIELE